MSTTEEMPEQELDAGLTAAYASNHAYDEVWQAARKFDFEYDSVRAAFDYECVVARYLPNGNRRVSAKLKGLMSTYCSAERNYKQLVIIAGMFIGRTSVLAETDDRLTGKALATVEP